MNLPKSVATFLVLGTLFIPRLSGALEINDKHVQESLESSSETLVLNGSGLREATIFKIDVYLATLYLAAKSSNAGKILESETPKVLILDFHRDVEAAKMKEAWVDGFKQQGKLNDQERQNLALSTPANARCDGR